MGVLTLSTDFGNADAYVGTMKGVALGVDASLRIVDLVHTVRPQNVLEGAFHLREAWPYFPPGTVHLAVVDPGVGTERRSLVAEAGGQIFVAPDNGLLPAVFAGRVPPGDVRYRVLDAKRFLLDAASRTFHGRDLYAPAAATLAAGLVSPKAAGSEPVLASAVVTLDRAEPSHAEDRAEGVVLHADHFGNLITNLDVRDGRVRALWERAAHVSIEGLDLPIVGTYGEAAPGALVALIDSFGLVEVAKVGGSAVSELGADVGSTAITLVARP